ncbi:hypothetical protein ST47_g10286 [Ascochyta rabiei]|uniref:Uncharacterized protein n=2 Tax=Didymella rabiei TaxID=5454 RepID=A0A162VRH2_DIDRA|nr:hypothetical protein ST47_g10286 [Ascochyta rabiei]
MELDTPLSSSHPLWTQPTHRELQQQQQQAGPGDPLGQPLQSNGAQPSATIHPSPSPQAAQPRPVIVAGSSIKDGRPDPLVNGQRNGYSYPRDPREVHFDAIERLQIQTAQNTSALAAQARSQTDYAEMMRQMEGSLRHEFQSQLHRQDQELRRMDESVNRLLQELQDCRRTIVTLAQGVNATRAESARRPSEIAQIGYQDEALELMAQRIGEVSHRTTDLETLRDHMAIMGGRVQRLESESAATHIHSRPTLPAYQPSHPPHVANAAPPHANHVASIQAPPRPTSNPQPAPHHEKPAVAVSESSQRHEPAPNQNGWTTVNAGVKRVFENDTNSPHQSAGSAPGSPKRPRLVTGESPDVHSMPHIPPAPSHILSSQTQPIVASQPQPHSGLQSGPHPGLPSSQAYVLYGTQDSPSDQNWRPESKRVTESRPSRGRGSRGGRGPGSRGGRVRRSVQEQHRPVRTPEWERDGWTAVPDSQASPIGFEDSPLHVARGTVRRGSGGSGTRGGSLLMERQNDWTPEIGPRSVFHEPHSETKKTRSKPVRNEEGILVRKDGRPDRRSQSSAANLRKVHARKEEQQREGEAGSTPNGLHHSMSRGPDTPSLSPLSQPEPDVTNSVRKRHNDILGKIFPDGIDSSRKQHDYAHQVFNEDRDHTAHPRAHSSRTTKKPPRIKKEYVERSEVAETQTPTNSDIDLDDAGSLGNGHTQNSAQAPAGAPAGSPQRPYQNQANPEQESRVQIPEAKAMGRLASAVVGSVEAA